ncbi:hypothetical protein HPP92_024346 [Vanilla planifolia]|uniref:Cytochrome P450 n=1 Tax=Vanilla planifolia TaxID=51239 RepID=A0A835PSM1_VANPL|nr:hypothetical protein HPP92_024346 [Vanilla planifolia]
MRSGSFGVLVDGCRPSLSAGASWALPRSPIRCLDVSYTPKEGLPEHKEGRVALDSPEEGRSESPWPYIKTIACNCAGLGFPHGPYWRQLRRICSLEVLSNRRVRSFSSRREEAARELVDHLRSASAVPVNLTRLFLSLTNDHVTRAAF